MVEYFKTFSETFIFETYKDTLLMDSELPFPPELLSIENKELFYRLKFRALNSTIK